MELLNLSPDRVAALLAAPAVQSLVARADARRAEVHALHPLSAEAQDRVLRKFRLDWTYHSNAIEGNALTYGETTALLLEGAVAQGKPMKDHEDIKGHHHAVDLLLGMVRQDEELRLHDVRNLHQLLLGKPFQVSARTPDGHPTQKWIYPGEYKDTPNHVRTATGEMHYYASPEETPALMTALFDWLSASRDAMPAPVRSALFHHAFVSIHPFGDGNGRMTRLLSNLLLMQAGYPPVVVRQQDRTAYYGALRQADAGEMTPLIGFLGEGLIRSLDIQLQGAQGDFSFEQDDLDKEIALLKQSFNQSEWGTESLNSISLGRALKELLINILNSLALGSQNLDSLFYESEWRIRLKQYPDKAKLIASSHDPSQLVQELEAYEDYWLKPELEADSYPDNFTFYLSRYWNNFRSTKQSFSFEWPITIVFDRLTFRISTSRPDLTVTKLYNQRLTSTEAKELTLSFARGALDEIKAKTNRV